ncbi:MAG TPA: class I SAM-dependent methyltransferase [Bryobacteraceae bacterium]|nr:class I SAM-dependent methyltransferase [Bryobacteraceae bacterium]
MSSAPQTQAPSPALIFDTLNAHVRTAALRGAIELDLFSAIAEGNSSVATIAKRIQASEKGTRVLCDFLVTCGFLTKANQSYGLTTDSAAFLNRHSPAYLGSASHFLGNPALTEAFHDLAAVVRKGGCLHSEGTVEPENPIWVDFAHSMAPMMRMPAGLIAKMAAAEIPGECKVLDIAAGHGVFGIAVAVENPKAQIVAVDWAPVLAVAEENAQKAGVANRHSKIPGSAFDVEFGSNYDLVLITNFLHHFDIPTNESLLRKIHAALVPGGMAVTLEFIPNDDRVTPPMDASFAMMMLGSTPHGDAYTFAEYDKMFSNAGFSRSEMRELTPAPQRVVVSYK